MMHRILLFCFIFLVACQHQSRVGVKADKHDHSIYLFGSFYSFNPDIKLILKTDFTYELRFINGRCTGDFVRGGDWMVQKDTIYLTETSDSIPSMCMGGTYGVEFISQKQEQPIYIHNLDTLLLGKTKLVRTTNDSIQLP